MKLRPAAQRAVMKGHPWVFSDGIEKLQPDGHPGDLAMIFHGNTNKLVAIGLYDPASPIRIKVIHRGGPQRIDPAFFRAGLERAMELRQPLLDGTTNAYRLLFGENDGFPGLIMDVYDQVAVAKMYSAIWFPWLEGLVPHFAEVSGATTVVVRYARQLLAGWLPFPEGSTLFGRLENPEVVFHEHGVRFKAHVLLGHKTGFFLDHRANRHRVGRSAKGRTVLDVFSYAGGFAVHALAGGAVEATCIDVSAQALEMAKRNAALNGAEGKLRTIQGDAFQRLYQLAGSRQRYDLVVIDPPSLAKSAKERDGALRKYGQLAAWGARSTRPGGMLVLASCSSRISEQEFLAAHRDVFAQMHGHPELSLVTGHDIDHPIGFAEGAYLKTAYYRMP